MHHAASGPDSALDTEAWARVALANARAGETVPFMGAMCTVLSVSEKVLRLREPDGKTRTFSVISETMERLVRDLGGRLLAAQHGAASVGGVGDVGDMLAALRRDPAFSVGAGGVPELNDLDSPGAISGTISGAIPGAIPGAAPDKATLAFRCVDLELDADVEELHDMVGRSREISFDDFAQHADWKPLAKSMGYATEPSDVGLRLSDDWAASFHASTWRGEPVQYMLHSAIEFVFRKQLPHKAIQPASPWGGMERVDTAAHAPGAAPRRRGARP